MSARRFREEDLALAASELVYEAGDDGEAFPIPDGEQYRSLRDGGYRVERVYSDAGTGFKAVQLTSDLGGPPIFASAGLEFERMSKVELQAVLADAGAALGTGADQFDSFDANEMKGEIANAAASGRVILAGQSLGGRLTQGFAYAHAAGLPDGSPNTVHAYTFNAIGGVPLIEAATQGPVDPEIAARANVSGFAIENDPFATHTGGRHIGPVRVYADPRPYLPTGDERREGQPGYRGNIDNHFFGPLRDIPGTHGWGEEGAVRVIPPHGYRRTLDGRPADWRSDDPDRLRNPDHWPGGGQQRSGRDDTPQTLPAERGAPVSPRTLLADSTADVRREILPARPDAPAPAGETATAEWEDPRWRLPAPDAEPLDLLRIPVSDWAEADAHLLIDHPAYRQPWRPEHAEVFGQVKAFYEHLYGRGTLRARTDGTYPEPELLNAPKPRSALAPRPAAGSGATGHASAGRASTGRTSSGLAGGPAAGLSGSDRAAAARPERARQGPDEAEAAEARLAAWQAASHRPTQPQSAAPAQPQAQRPAQRGPQLGFDLLASRPGHLKASAASAAALDPLDMAVRERRVHGALAARRRALQRWR